MKRIGCILIWILSSTVFCLAQNTVYCSQVADGNDGTYAWITVVFVANPAAIGTSTANVTITFTQDDGTPFNIPLTDVNKVPAGSGNTLSFSISGGQSRYYISTGTPALKSGYATVASNVPVQATTIFEEYSMVTGSGIASAAVLSATPLMRQAIAFYEKGGADTGFAIANPGSTSASVTLQLLDIQGVAALPPTTIQIPAHTHKAEFISQLFANTRGLFGTMQITSSVPTVTTALYFNSDGTFFTGPVITLASLFNSAAGWLERRFWFHALGGLRWS